MVFVTANWTSHDCKPLSDTEKGNYDQGLQWAVERHIFGKRLLDLALG